MMEAEWLANTDPQAMLRELEWRWNAEEVLLYRSDRKLRLFACACHGCSTGKYPEVAYGEEGANLLARAWADVNAYPTHAPTQQTKAALLRDIFGNPWRPVTLWTGTEKDCVTTDQSGTGHWWNLTPTVRSLAQAAYDDRQEDGTLDPDRLLVLADALEEAGCAEESLLAHLRNLERCPECPSPAHCRKAENPCEDCGCTGWRRQRNLTPHVRGCWAVDLTLGKE